MNVTGSPGSRYAPARLVAGIGSRISIYGRGIAEMLPRLVFGNGAGLRNNLAPQRELARLRRAFDSGDVNLAEEPFASRAASLQDQGFVLAGRSVDRALIDGIRVEVSRLLADPGAFVPSPNGATQFIFDPLAAIPAVRQLLTPELCRTIAAYYGCALRVESVRLWRNHHVPGIDADRDDRFSNTFHHDGYAVTGLRVFILLSDGVNRETGALRLHDRRTSASIVRSLGYFHRARLAPGTRARLRDPATLRFFEGDAGDTCIANTQQCLHAASVPRAGSHRDMLQFEVYPAAGPYDAGARLFEGLPADLELLKMRAAQR